MILAAQQPVVDSSRSHHESKAIVEYKAAITADSLQFEVVRNSKNPSDSELNISGKQKEGPSSTARRKNNADYGHPYGF